MHANTRKPGGRHCSKAPLPQNIQQHLSDVIDLCPGLTEDLLSTVDQPLKVMKDDMKQKDFIICDYNRWII